MKIFCYNIGTKQATSKDVPSVFSKESINEHVIWELIVAENANLRQGTHKTKCKGEVRGGGKKPWKQKGTGSARAGSRRSPVWVGGGTVFGPQPRDYSYKVNTKKKNVGYKSILSKKIHEEKLAIVSGLSLDKISTSTAFTMVDDLLKASPFYTQYSSNRKLVSKTNDNHRTITIVYHKDDAVLKKSFGNIPWINLIHVDRLSARFTYYNHGILFSEEAFEKITEKYNKR